MDDMKPRPVGRKSVSAPERANELPPEPRVATARPVRVLRMRRTMLRLLPLTVLLLLVAGRIGLLEWHNSGGRNAFARSEFAAAAGEFDANRSLNPFERWIAPFNEGVAHHRAGALETAIADYGTALETVPRSRECTVRVNLALAHEARGNALDDSGDGADARREWQAGRDALAAGRCPTQAEQGQEERDRAGAVDERLADKLDDGGQETPSPSSSSSSPSGSPSPTPGEPSQEQLDQLEELNREGADTRRDNEELQDGGVGDGGYHW